jgi:opacity protein-like surface antigen
MFKIFLSFCFVATFVSSASAFNSDLYPYVGITLGSPLTSINSLSDSSGSLDTEFKPGYMAGFTAGISFETVQRWNINRIRAEAEVGYRSSELSRMKNSRGISTDLNGTLTVANYMLNGYLDNLTAFTKDTPVSLFISAGAGVAVASISSITNRGTILVNSSKNTQLAYQGGIGAGYELTKSFGLDVTYKYLGTTPFKFAGVKAEYGSHNILFGAKYSFK